MGTRQGERRGRKPSQCPPLGEAAATTQGHPRTPAPHALPQLAGPWLAGESKGGTREAQISWLQFLWAAGSSQALAEEQNPTRGLAPKGNPTQRQAGLSGNQSSLPPRGYLLLITGAHLCPPPRMPPSGSAGPALALSSFPTGLSLPLVPSPDPGGAHTALISQKRSGSHPVGAPPGRVLSGS